MNNNKNNNNSVEIPGSNIITKEFLNEILKLNETHSPEIEKFTFKSALGKGENYLSIIYRVKLTLKDKSLRQWIIKTMPNYLKVWLEENETFKREINVYDKWLPKMLQICERKLIVGEEKITPLWPKYYKAKSKELLVLEDLSLKDFRNEVRHDQLNLDYSLLVLRKLGRYHGSTLALIKEYPILGEIIGEPIYRKNNEENQKRSKMQFDMLSKIVSTWKGYERFVPIIKKLYVDSYEIILDIMNKGKCKVLCHGDFWSNNILFKFDTQDKPCDLRFVDFQMSRVASPVIDIIYFINSSVQHNVWINNKEKLIGEYYKSFEETANSLDIQIPISVEDIYEEIDDKWYYNFTVASFIMAAVVADPSEAFEIEKLEGDVDGSFFEKALRGKRYGELYRKKLIYFEEKGYFKDLI